MYKFENNDLITGYIKEKLRDFNLPKAHVYKNNMPIYKNVIYIKDNNIVMANTTVKNIDEINDSNFTVLQPFLANEKILNFTENLKINGTLYDSYTHAYLGDYLRFIRDYYNVDLMSMYNCFGNQSPANFTYTYNKDGFNINFDTSDTAYTLFMLPVKFFSKYLIGINCEVSYEYILGFYDENKQLFTKFDISKEEDEYNEFIRDTYNKVSASKLSKPYLLDTSKFIPSDILYTHENDLKLIIKLPFSIKTAITVVETQANNYDNGHPYILCDNDRFNEINKSLLYNSKSQLFNILGTTSYPFADRLLEYLLDSAITPLDESYKNIVRVQNKLSRLSVTVDDKDATNSYDIETLGKWDKSLRAYVYWYSRDKSQQEKYDMIGYVDSDIERMYQDYDYTEFTKVYKN